MPHSAKEPGDVVLESSYLAYLEDPDLSAEALEAAVNNAHPLVRATVAQRPDLSEQQAMRLAEDKSPLVQRSLLDNWNAPENARVAAALHKL